MYNRGKRRLIPKRTDTTSVKAFQHESFLVAEALSRCEYAASDSSRLALSVVFVKLKCNILVLPHHPMTCGRKISPRQPGRLGPAAIPEEDDCTYKGARQKEEVIVWNGSETMFSG